MRAPGTESAGGGYNIDNTPTYYANQWSYHRDVTEQERVNSDVPLRPDEDATQFIMQKLMIRKEKLWAANYFTAGIWGTNYTGVASAGLVSATTVLQWNDALSNPMQDIATAQTAIMAATGYKPNKLVLGVQVYQALRNNPAILDRIKYTMGPAIPTESIMAQLFDVKEVLVASSVVNASAQGSAESTNFILGKNALLAYVAPNPGIKQPTAGYTFAWSGLMGASAYGSRISRFPMIQLGLGTMRIEGDMAFDQKLVASDLAAYFGGVIA